MVFAVISSCVQLYGVDVLVCSPGLKIIDAAHDGVLVAVVGNSPGNLVGRSNSKALRGVVDCVLRAWRADVPLRTDSWS